MHIYNSNHYSSTIKQIINDCLHSAKENPFAIHYIIVDDPKYYEEIFLKCTDTLFNIELMTLSSFYQKLLQIYHQDFRKKTDIQNLLEIIKMNKEDTSSLFHLSANHVLTAKQILDIFKSFYLYNIQETTKELPDLSKEKIKTLFNLYHQFDQTHFLEHDLIYSLIDEKCHNYYYFLTNQITIPKNQALIQKLDQYGHVFIYQDTNGPKNLEITLTRQKFNELTKGLIDRLVLPMQTALNDARLTPQDLNKIILVGGSSRILAVQEKVKEITNMEPSKSLNPDECVALGAAIQAGKLSGEMVLYGEENDVLLLDVTPLTLSIETVGGVATPLIPRNTTVPTSHSQVFTTSANFQTQVEINVLQGERPLAKDNQSLGKFKLKKIKRAMRGVPQIEVTFDIDSNGIVHVSAKDLASGNSQSMTIEGSSKMSDSDIEEAIRQAKMYESQDQVTKDNMLLKNEVETLIINVQNGLASHKKEMDKALRKQIKAELSSLMKMTRKFNYETASSQEIQKIKDSKNHLESLAQNIIGR